MMLMTKMLMTKMLMTVMNDDADKDKEEDNDENYEDVNGEPVSVGETRSNLPFLASSATALKNKHNIDDRGDDGNDDVLGNHGDNDIND